MTTSIQNNTMIHPDFYNFINVELLPKTNLEQDEFWRNFVGLIEELSPTNSQLLAKRAYFQEQINQWHIKHKNKDFDAAAYQVFLAKIGYIVESGDDFTITTQGIDDEIASTAGPQLVVPVSNSRFALNAANARWGSLYDALYGSDVIPQITGLKKGNKLNKSRANAVVSYAKEFLDNAFPLTEGSHQDVENYVIYYKQLLAFFPDGSTSGLRQPKQLVALTGHKEYPNSIVLKNHGLHVELILNRSGQTGKTDISGLEDIQIESALTTIVDFEDSVAAVDAEDKIFAYQNWYGLIQNDLKASFIKNERVETREMNKDKFFTALNGDTYRLPGRAKLLVRNVGHAMTTDLMKDKDGNEMPEGLIDAVVTSLIALTGLTSSSDTSNSKHNSIYIVKPKMHGPEEVAFTCQTFTAVEKMLGLAQNTIKLGIMDEERRTTVNLKACIREAKERVFFINTGFLDRTGDEIHTNMQAGITPTKAEIKEQTWLSAYEDNNVDVGLACGFSGKAQIGKGMWSMPDEMNKMMVEKIAHPKAGASTAWVPSPTAATLHALHYHYVDVKQQQQEIQTRESASLTNMLTPSTVAESTLTEEEVTQELENNIQGILGYVARWVNMGIGCSKVPDINNIGLMEDRATLRISSQLIANWLQHNVCSEEQVNSTLKKMAVIVDQQNQGIDGYQAITPNISQSYSFKAAQELIFAGVNQANGYTEPLLHKYRKEAKKHTAEHLLNAS